MIKTILLKSIKGPGFNFLPSSPRRIFSFTQKTFCSLTLKSELFLKFETSYFSTRFI